MTLSNVTQKIKNLLNPEFFFKLYHASPVFSPLIQYISLFIQYALFRRSCGRNLKFYFIQLVFMIQRLRSTFFVPLVIIYTRYLLGGAMVFASFIKIKGQRFTSTSGELSPMGTYLHFFETLYQSGWYWQFLGLGQLVGGALLMTQRYSRAGALLVFGIMVNIFVITISINFNYTPIITGLMLLASLLLLIWDEGIVAFLLNRPTQGLQLGRVEQSLVWTVTGCTLLLFTAIYRLAVDRYSIVFWGLGSMGIGLLGLLRFLHISNGRKQTI